MAAASLACGVVSPTTVTDSQARLPVDYDAFVPPAAGASYVDPVFGTAIRRLSDARATRDASSGAPALGFITNEYSTMSPFNRDSTRLLLQHQSYFALYDGEGRYLRDMPFEIHAGSEPRWSRRDPEVLYYVSGNQLRRFHVGTQTASLVRAFAEYGRISGHGESDVCFDGDHLVLAGDGRQIFVFDLGTGDKGPSLDTGGRAFDSITITPDDHVTVTWLRSGAARYEGVELFDRDMTFLRHVARAGGHGDLTRDLDGREVLVWANAADPSPVCPNGIVKVRLLDGAQTCLLSLDWRLAVHISGPDSGGWVFAETYAPSDPPAQVGAWPPYANEILQIRLDGSVVRRLAHHRSRPFDAYNYTPRVATDRSGRRIVYSSNFRLQALRGYPSAYTDVYRIDVAP